jgi:hypothetical protein
MKRTEAYVATVTDMNDPVIAELKRSARILNAELRLNELRGLGNKKEYCGRVYVYRYRVTIKPRLGKNNSYAHLYRVGGKLHRNSSQTIRPEHGHHFDVYLHCNLVSRKK